MTTGVFGDDTGSSVLFSVECSGDETEIMECSLSVAGTCLDHSSAVVCQGLTL